MRLVAFPAPPFDESAYLLSCDETREAVVIDPGDGTPALIRDAKAAGVRVKAILLTHAHIDHITGVALAKASFEVPVYLHTADRFLYDAVVDQGRYFGIPVSPQPPIDAPLNEGMSLDLGRLALRVHETPGHSPGHVIFEVRQPAGAVDLVVGDTLFAGSIGRTDLPGGDYNTLIDSIKRVLFSFPDHTAVHPGHYDSTTIGTERRENPFLRG
jgi:glyoxylase-like metal-dependent hydrolase (beta-lactamase superfamily II)